MPVSNKHGEAMTQKVYPMFNGGLNLKLPPESLEANELSEAMNVELSPVTGAIRSRGGLVWDATTPNGSEIEDIVPIPGYHGFLIRTTNGQLYTDIWHTLWPVTGTLSGNDKMSVALFSDTGKCMVASGGKLQVLSPYEKSLEIIENSPDNCRLVCVKEGRVCVVEGDSTLRFSWVGDYENWAEFNDVQSSDPNDGDMDYIGPAVERLSSIKVKPTKTVTTTDTVSQNNTTSISKTSPVPVTLTAGGATASTGGDSGDTGGNTLTVSTDTATSTTTVPSITTETTPIVTTSTTTTSTTELGGTTEDDSMGQFVEIGYKDGMRIVAVVPLSQDLIIFKAPSNGPDKGIIYRLTGTFPDWQVVEVAHNTGTFSQGSVQVIGNDVYYLSREGLATLSSVTSYGDIKTMWPDRKIAGVLTHQLGVGSQLWNVSHKQQLWILPIGTDEVVPLSARVREASKGVANRNIWVFDYYNGVWSQFEFPEKPVLCHSDDNRVYVVLGKYVYSLDDFSLTDKLHSGSTGNISVTYRDHTGANRTVTRQYAITNDSEIDAKVKLGRIQKGLHTLVKGAFASYSVPPSGKADVYLDKFKMSIEARQGPVSYAASDNTTAYTNDRYVIEAEVPLTARRRCIVRNWSETPVIEFTGGGVSLNSMGLNTVEV